NSCPEPDPLSLINTEKFRSVWAASDSTDCRKAAGGLRTGRMISSGLTARPANFGDNPSTAIFPWQAIKEPEKPDFNRETTDPSASPEKSGGSIRIIRAVRVIR